MAAITGIVVGPDYMPRFPQESCAEREQGKRATLGNFTRLSPIVTCRAPHAHRAKNGESADCLRGGRRYYCMVLCLYDLHIPPRECLAGVTLLLQHLPYPLSFDCIVTFVESLIIQACSLTPATSTKWLLRNLSKSWIRPTRHTHTTMSVSTMCLTTHDIDRSLLGAAARLPAESQALRSKVRQMARLSRQGCGACH